MLELIRTLPMLALIVLPLLGGGIAGFLQHVRYEWVVIPRELAVQKAALEADYQRRVAEAIAAEQLRQFKILERMTAEWQKALEEELAWRDAKVELLEQEIADYETAEGDTACRLDQGDVDFLLGGGSADPARSVRALPTAPPG